MELWQLWTTLIFESISALSTTLGLSAAVAIIVFTVVARLLLLPVFFTAAYKVHKNKLAMDRLKPQIDRLRDQFKDDPREMMQRTMALYKKHDVRLLDRTAVLNIGSQTVLGLGIFQTMRQMVFHSKFFWIADIAKPDALLALFVSCLTFGMMMLMPSAEQSAMLMFLIPALISVFVLANMSSALGLYWATSTLTTIGQTLSVTSRIRYQENHSTQ